MPDSVIMLLCVVGIVLLVIFLGSMLLCSVIGDKGMKIGIVCGVLGFLMVGGMMIYDHFTSGSSSSGSNGPDLYDHRTWDYDGDGKMDDKETRDYLEFKQEMEKEARRQTNK